MLLIKYLDKLISVNIVEHLATKKTFSSDVSEDQKWM